MHATQNHLDEVQLEAHALWVTTTEYIVRFEFTEVINNVCFRSFIHNSMTSQGTIIVQTVSARMQGEIEISHTIYQVILRMFVTQTVT